MTLWEILKANKTGIAPDMFTMLAASKMNGGRDRLHELSGTPPLSFTAKGKPLTAWSITGNTVQNGTPTPENPVEVQAVGDRTGNLFDYKKYFESTFTKYSEYFEFAEIQLKPFTTYTFATSFGDVLISGTTVPETSFIITTSAEEPKTLTGGISSNRIGTKTKTTEQDGIIKIYKRIKGRNLPKKEDFDSGMHWLMINEGDTALSYEPYGYKIPVVTRGKNLAGNYTVSSGYYYDDSGTPTPSDARFIRLAINVEPNTIYTISSNLKFYSIWEFNNNTKISRRGGANSNKYTIKTTKKCNSLRISMSNTSGEADTSAFEWIQLEKGSTATPYEPYHEPITTPIYLPTPLYSGEVMRSDGSREVKWGVVDLGSMAYGYYNGLFYFTIPDKKESKNDIISLLICEKYIVTKTHSSMSCNNYEIYEYTGADKKRVVIRNDDYDNTKTFKEAMKGVMLYYELEEPKTETFTAPQIPTLNGTTVIDVDTAVKPESMTIKYRR